MNCPSTDRLSAFHDAVLPPAEARELSLHLQDCLPCRTAVERLQQVDRLVVRSAPARMPAEAGRRLALGLRPAPRRPFLPALAAAGLLAATGLSWWALAPRAAPPSSPAQTRPASVTLRGAEGRYRLLAPDVTLRLSPEAVLEVRHPAGEPLPSLTLSAGAVSLETASGPLLLQTPAGTLTLHAGWLAAAIGPEDAHWASLLCQEARAAEPGLRTTLFRGRATLRDAAGNAVAIPPGASATWRRGQNPEFLAADPSRLRRIESAWASVPASGWQDLFQRDPSRSRGALRTAQAYRLRGSAEYATLGYALASEQYVLEAHVRIEEMPGAGDLGIAYRAGERAVWWLRGGMTREALGVDPLAGGSELKIQVWVGEEILIIVNGRLCGRIPKESTQLSAQPLQDMDVGILSALGSVQVLSLQWRETDLP